MGQMRPKTKGAYPGPGMNEMVYNLVYSGTFLCLPIKIIYIRGRVHFIESSSDKEKCCEVSDAALNFSSYSLSCQHTGHQSHADFCKLAHIFRLIHQVSTKYR